MRGQEHPAGLGQQLQAGGRLTLPLGPAGKNKAHVTHRKHTLPQSAVT